MTSQPDRGDLLLSVSAAFPCSNRLPSSWPNTSETACRLSLRQPLLHSPRIRGAPSRNRGRLRAPAPSKAGPAPPSQRCINWISFCRYSPSPPRRSTIFPGMGTPSYQGKNPEMRICQAPGFPPPSSVPVPPTHLPSGLPCLPAHKGGFSRYHPSLRQQNKCTRRRIYNESQAPICDSSSVRCRA